MQYPEPDYSNTYRYIVLDENGVFLNRILVESPYPEGYFPGYGKYIVYEGEDPAPPVPENQEVYPGFIYLSARPLVSMERGDTMNIETGEVTPAPILEPVLVETPEQ